MTFAAQLASYELDRLELGDVADHLIAHNLPEPESRRNAVLREARSARSLRLHTPVSA